MKNYIEVKSLPDQNITITDDMINCVEILGPDINLKSFLTKMICRSTIKIDTKNKKAIINCTDTAKENTYVVIRNTMISILDEYRSNDNMFSIKLFIGDDKLMKLSFSTILEYHFLDGVSLIIILDFSYFKEYRKSIEDEDKKSDCLNLPNYNSGNGKKINTDIVTYYNPDFKISTTFSPDAMPIKEEIKENISNIVKDINCVFSACKKEDNSDISCNTRIHINDTLNTISLEYFSRNKYEYLFLKTLYCDIQDFLLSVRKDSTLHDDILSYSIVINNVIINNAVIINTKCSETKEGYKLFIIFKYKIKSVRCDNDIIDNRVCNFDSDILNAYSCYNTHVDNFVASVSSELVNDDDFYERYVFISNLNILYPKCNSVVVNYDHNKIIMRGKESEDAVRICTYMFDNFDVITDSSFYVFIDEIIDIKGEAITKSNIRFDSVYIHSLDYHHGKDYNIEVILSFTDYKVLKSETTPYDSNNNEQQNEKHDKLDYSAIVNYEDIEFISFSPRYPNYPKSRAVFDIAFQKIILDALYLNTDNKYTLNLDKGEILVEFSDDALNKTINSSLSLLGLGTNVVFDGSINDLVKYLKDTNTKSCDVDLNISIQLNKKIPFTNNDGKWMYGNLIDICASSITYNKHDLSKFTINYTVGDIVVYNE